MQGEGDFSQGAPRLCYSLKISLGDGKEILTESECVRQIKAIFPNCRTINTATQDLSELVESEQSAFELMATMNDKSPLRDISFNDLDSAILYQHALKGDPIAKEAFRLTGMRLGYALADAVTITSPEAIFVFGGLAKAGNLILDPIKWYMEENMLFAFKNKVKVLPSGLQNKNAAILGASALVWQKF